jgi:tetratricopeptide (TPR) repeat protein
MRRTLIGLALALFALPAWAQTRDENMAQCVGGDPDAAIAGCTALIQSGQETTTPLAVAYNNRAWNLHLKGQDAAALADASTAVTLAPTANHLETRAEIYERLGRRDAAIADYQASLIVDPDHQTSKDGLARLGVTP